MHREQTARKNTVKRLLKNVNLSPSTRRRYMERGEGGVETQILFSTSALDGGVNLTLGKNLGTRDTTPCVTTQKSAVLIYFAAEA
jgi:hypothetical protein